MPVVNIALSDADHQRLKHDYESLITAWAKLGRTAAPPSFETWLGTLVSHQFSEPIEGGPLDDVRLFNALEKLITSLPIHGFQLAHTAPGDVSTSTSSYSLAKSMVENFTLQPHYVKRLQELFTHYLKTPKEIADAAHVGVTNRTYGALTEAQKRLTAHVTESLERLGADRAIGRVEGATAMLVSLEVMDAAAAKSQTDSFKAEARAKKTPWVNKMFNKK